MFRTAHSLLHSSFLCFKSSGSSADLILRARAEMLNARIIMPEAVIVIGHTTKTR